MTVFDRLALNVICSAALGTVVVLRRAGVGCRERIP
jgi:hypothetical protein